jgi:hypothetical protein
MNGRLYAGSRTMRSILSMLAMHKYRWRTIYGLLTHFLLFFPRKSALETQFAGKSGEISPARAGGF